MSIWGFIKDKVSMILVVIIADIINCLMLRAFGIPNEAIIASGLICAISFFVVFLIEFIRKARFYNDYLGKIDELDKKYLIGNMINYPGFLEGNIVCDSIYDASKSMTEHVNEYKHRVGDFKDYIEMWIHEVKLPIAAMSLRIHNKMDMDPMLLSQLKRVEDYVEQVLFMVRSENADRDYLIKEINLARVCKSVIMKNKDILLESKVQPSINSLDYKVYTDVKWLEFILNQIVGNSIKYKRENVESFIKIYCERDEKYTILSVLDNGIGISDNDLPRVFDKTFTGENGRLNGKSTGIGLYIAKKLCTKLGHDIFIESKKGEYTKVSIVFGMNDYYLR